MCVCLSLSIYIFVINLTVLRETPKQVDTFPCSYLKEEWNYINKNGPPPNLPIAERIWSSLPSRIEKKKLRVNFSIPMFLCIIS